MQEAIKSALGHLKCKRCPKRMQVSIENARYHRECKMPESMQDKKESVKDARKNQDALKNARDAKENARIQRECKMPESMQDARENARCQRECKIP